jgi:hypothetical protein
MKQISKESGVPYESVREFSSSKVLGDEYRTLLDTWLDKYDDTTGVISRLKSAELQYDPGKQISDLLESLARLMKFPMTFASRAQYYRSNIGAISLLVDQAEADATPLESRDSDALKVSTGGRKKT